MALSQANKASARLASVAAASIIFIGCAALGTYAPARTTATVFAFGVDLAVLLKVLPGGNATQVTNWPPEYIPCGHLLPVNGGGVSAKPDCSGSGVLSPTSGGANAGNAPEGLLSTLDKEEILVPPAQPNELDNLTNDVVVNRPREIGILISYAF